MKKKLQIKNGIDSNIMDSYITYMEYFATGEGMTYEINFCYAIDKKEAIEKHLDRFYGKNKRAKDYFRVGIVAFESKSKKAEEILNEFFKEERKLLTHLNNAGTEFHFKIHYNYS